MARLDFSYTMEISFSQAVKDHHFTLRCLPRSGSAQRLLSLSIDVSPAGKLSLGADSFGNPYVYGCRSDPHSRFSAEVTGTVRSGSGFSPLPEAGLGMYRVASALTRPGPALQELYAALPPEPGESPASRAGRRMEQVYRRMAYSPGVTAARTTAEDAAALGRGVCQDYAHILLALLRMDGIPCRYVCGMMVGEGASHAWVEAAAESGWIALDPTNFRAAGEDYLVFSVGRDAGDCAINRGVYQGWAEQNTIVSARVCRVEEKEHDSGSNQGLAPR